MDTATEITMELLGDIATALRGVSRDFLPGRDYTVTVNRRPPCVVLRIPGATSKPMERALYDLGQAVRAVTDRVLPSLPLRVMVVGGTEAAGIEIRLKGTPAAPAYGHIIKAKVERLMVAEALKGKPQLVDAVVRQFREVSN